jgi:sterol desaturase/sphingolipid hydroxylase (fatty acid hydroxylase superfamily)
VPVATVILFVLYLLAGSAAFPIFAGVAFGYLAYDLLHYAGHAGALRGRVGHYLRQHHMTHHYRLPETRFGVSSPLWDRVFGTLR